MPPKKDEVKGKDESTVKGFEPKETKLLAAGFLSMTGPDKYDYDVMATLTGNTAGSLKKMFPPVKKKAIETLPSFASYITGGAATSTAAANGEKKEPAPKAASRKRKATSEPETDAAAAAAEDLQPNGDKSDENTDGKKKKAPAKPRARSKKVKKEPTPEQAAEGGDNGNDAQVSDEV